MKWLSVKMIRKAGKHSELLALQFSYIHWMQLYLASREDLVQRDVLHMSRGDHCALCHRYCLDLPDDKHCLECPLFENGNGCNEPNSIWRKAVGALSNAVDFTEDSMARCEWNEAALDVASALRELISDMYEDGMVPRVNGDGSWELPQDVAFDGE